MASMNKGTQQAIINKAMEVAVEKMKEAEKGLDQAIEHFDNLGQDDLMSLRLKRKKELEEKQKMRDTWLQQGHGVYTEIADEKQWFEECKGSKHVVTHFYRPTTEYCQLLDKHLEILAKKHIETKFIKINAEKCNYLVTRLNIVVMPTLILTEDNKVADRLEGFTDLGNTAEFTTDTLAKRLSKQDIIEYVPDMSHMLQQQSTYNAQNKTGKAIYESKKFELLQDDNDDWLFEDD